MGNGGKGKPADKGSRRRTLTTSAERRRSLLEKSKTHVHAGHRNKIRIVLEANGVSLSASAMSLTTLSFLAWLGEISFKVETSSAESRGLAFQVLRAATQDRSVRALADRGKPVDYFTWMNALVEAGRGKLSGLIRKGYWRKSE